ncbi:MAG TPA: hypothetical protein VI583_14790 [Cyclobacteriaceae bacterium]|nr:hypothetical protein [Cyclobacteriaceae bacterium]
MNFLFKDWTFVPVLILPLFLLMSVTTFASDTRATDPMEYSDNEDVWDAIKGILDPPSVQKKPSMLMIYNRDLELIRVEDEDSCLLKRLVVKSDFIAQIGNLKFYRLCK